MTAAGGAALVLVATFGLLIGAFILLKDGYRLRKSLERRISNQSVERRISAAESAIETATDKKAKNNFNSAKMKYDEGISAYQEALDLIGDESSDIGSEITESIKSARAELDAVEEQKQAHQSVSDKLDTITEELDTAVDKQSSENSESPEQHIDAAEKLLEEAISTADEYGFDKLGEMLAEQKERRIRIKEQPQTSTTSVNNQSQTSTTSVNNQSQTSTTSVNIPTAPQLSLTYDDIEKGEPIGSGGNGDVFRATATTDTGEFALAIKEPRVSGTVDTGTMEELIDEAETWQQLDDHDHIVSVVDYGSTPLPWIGMEYMDGGDLSERVGELSVEQALWTALAITKGVRYAHKRGVAHLDLKPSNILFRSVEDAWDVPKVADWGLSKHLLEHSRSVEGMSPRYAAPEQLDTEQFGQTDMVTDVYQLGTVLYELFTGEPPFDGETYEVMNKIQSSTPVPPSERADLPDVIDDVLLTALATERGDRYDDVLYIRDALQDVWEEYK